VVRANSGEELQKNSLRAPISKIEQQQISDDKPSDLNRVLSSLLSQAPDNGLRVSSEGSLLRQQPFRT